MNKCVLHEKKTLFIKRYIVCDLENNIKLSQSRNVFFSMKIYLMISYA